MNRTTILTTLLLVALPLAGPRALGRYAARLRGWALAAVLLSTAAAGCIDAPGAVDTLSGATAPDVLPHLELSDAHDHKDPAQHRAAWNMQQLGWAAPVDDVTKLGRYNHVVVHGDHAFMTAYSLEAGGAPGLAVFDVRGDAPQLLSTLTTPDVTPIDVHASADGKYLVLGGHRDNRFALPGDLQTCSGTPLVEVCTPFVPGGVILVDVTDPSAPAVVDTFTSVPSGAHTAKIEQYGDDYYVFVASYGFANAGRIASQVEILRIDSTPMGLKMLPVARFQAEQLSGNNGEERVFVHDMFVADHPDGRRLMYVSYWDGGVVIADVTDPERPTQLSAWKDFDIATYGNIHFARPIGEINGRHISYAAPEFGSADHAGQAYILDTTDPEAPELIATWTLPGDPTNDGGYRFSPHNFDPRGTKLVYAHYHGGIWVVDLADPANPVVEAYATPTLPEGAPEYEHREDAPNIWAAVWTDAGTVLASDIGVGLYHYRVLEPDGSAPPYERFLR